MTVNFGNSHPYCLQHTLTGAATFSAAAPRAIGYARLGYVNGATKLTLRAKTVGTAGNALSVQFVNPVPMTLAASVAKLETPTQVVVLLKNDGVAVTATAADVALAINRFRDTSRGTPLEMPIAAGVEVAGAVAALAATLLTGGLDPAADDSPALIRLTSAANGGLFFFEPREPMIVTEISGELTGAVAWEVRRANVDRGLNVITGETNRIAESAAPSNNIQLIDYPIPMMPGQAIQVIAATQGLVQVFGRRASRDTFV